MKPTMFFLMNSIDTNRGGLTKASLKQASFFAEMGYETHMLTFNFNPRNPIIREKLVDMNKVHKNVIIRNMFEELEGYNEPLSNGAPPKKASLIELSKELPIDKREGHNAYRVFDNGMYSKYISLHDNNALHFIDYYNEGRYRVKRETYDLWGNLKLVTYMDLNLNKPRQLIYYNNSGKAFLTQWNNPKNGKVQRIILFNEDSIIKNAYINDNVSHKVNWLNDVINNTKSSRSVIVSDTRSTDEVLVKFNHPNAAKIWRLHSGHVGTPYTTDADIASAVKIGLENIDNFDAAVFLTEQQKKDIINRFGEKPNLHVIPHFHEIPKKPLSAKVKNTLTKTKTNNNMLGIVVSRLSTLKRIDDIIKSFQIVVSKMADARLEIYGIGDQMDNLEQLIKELNLEDNVFLKGYAQYPDEKYQRGIFSVLTSKQEGFALSVLESMYNRTPVISYNIRYGPTDMIVNEKNGYIVENGNIEKLAEKMLFLFNNPKIAREMGQEAHKYIEEHFNKSQYKKKWLNVVEQAIKNKFH